MKLTLEDKIKIIELRKKGLGYETIAKKFKVKHSLIQKPNIFCFLKRIF